MSQTRFVQMVALAIAAATVVGTVTLPARAQQASPGKPEAWADKIKFSTVIDAGITFNPDDPADEKNFGRLFDDKANSPLLNQLRLTLERPIDPALETYDFGFKLQAMYGSDARYTHFLGELDNVTSGTNQFDIVEANVQAHTPWLTAGGLDFKIGQFVTLEGAETIDTATNYFYSHSYIFNFGIPFKHTGAMATLHATPFLDLYAGITTGVNTSLGNGDNNDSLSFHGGIGLTLLDGKLTSLATTHIGPEIAEAAITNGLLPPTVNANDALRYLNDITTTWKVNDKLTLINDLNYILDEALNAGQTAEGFGVAQYAAYALNDMYTLAVRGEIWRDVDGVFVCQFGNNVDFVRGEKGLPALSTRTVCGGKTTYGAITLGVNIKPELKIPYLQSLMLRPEVRWDTSINGTKPYDDSTDKDMFTVAFDVVLTF